MKTQTEHTPGPWQHDAARDQITSQHEDWKHSLICKIATGEDRKQEDANARLIAAAPTQHAALCAIVRLLDRSQPMDIPGALMVAQSAIRAAQGGGL
jgi:hypothetical protein